MGRPRRRENERGKRAIQTSSSSSFPSYQISDNSSYLSIGGGGGGACPQGARDDKEIRFQVSMNENVSISYYGLSIQM